MVKIFLVEDHPVVRFGIKALLEANEEFVVVGESDNGYELLEQIKNIQVDLVITDISMEGMSGIELTKKIKKVTNNAVKVLVLSMHADELFINQCFESGANGYLLKDFKKIELFTAVEKIMKGEMYVSRSVSQILANNYLKKEFSIKSKTGKKVDITKREREIIEYISLGFSNKEIATKILVSTATVDVHRYNILKKLEVKNTAEMIMKAIKLELIIIKS